MLRLVAGSQVSVEERRRSQGRVMNIAALFIKRPVTTALIMLGIIVFGAMSVPACCPVSDLPTVDFPTIQVGASFARRAAQRRWRPQSRCRSRNSSRRIAGTSIRSIRPVRRATQTSSTCSSSLSRNIDAAAQDVQAMICEHAAPAAADRCRRLRPMPRR